MNVFDYIDKTPELANSAEKLYEVLMENTSGTNPWERENLREGMAVVNELMWGWWKPRYLLNHNTKRAMEFMDRDQCLVRVKKDDIDWDSLGKLPEDVRDRARRLSFHFPSFIHRFENGVAEVEWQLNPDGRYYMDGDGYGMTSDDEINIYGFIDQNGKVVEKFRRVRDTDERSAMRKKAEGIVSAKSRNSAG